MIMTSKEDITNMGDEGYLLASGFGHEIPADVKAMLLEKYRFDADSAT